jgi:bacterioferritin-associated ferredoxin
MDPDDHVCLCFRVSLRKLRHFVARTHPKVPSQLSECLGAGTGCRWCVPFLEKLHRQWASGETMELPVAPAEYASRRAEYRRSGRREGGTGPAEATLPDD